MDTSKEDHNYQQVLEIEIEKVVRYQDVQLVDIIEDLEFHLALMLKMENLHEQELLQMEILLMDLDLLLEVTKQDLVIETVVELVMNQMVVVLQVILVVMQHLMVVVEVEHQDTQMEGQRYFLQH